MKNITETPEWADLKTHYNTMLSTTHVRDLFASDPHRGERFNAKSGQLQLDYSRNRISATTMQYLYQLAEASQLKDKIEALFTGQRLNNTEHRPALHTALRDKGQTAIWDRNINIANEIAATQKQLRDFVRQVHQGMWRGITGKVIKHIVNIGIGGSHLGPMMTSYALKDFAVSSLKMHFVSGIDKSQLLDVWEEIDPETTLFIVSSKSFTTLETLTNAK